MEKFDAIIIGAGIAGLCSAVTALNFGMKTAIIEKENFLGGISQDCFHSHICGLFKNDFSTPFQIANPGICSEIYQYLYECYGDQCLVTMGKVEIIAFLQNDLWNYFSNIFNKKNLIFLKNTKCIQIKSNKKKVESITILNESRKTDLCAQFYFDATGCSEPFNHSANKPSQLFGYCMLFQGVLKNDLSIIIPYTARKIVSDHRINDYLKFITITHHPLSDKHILKFSVKNSDDIENCHFIYDKLKDKIKDFAKLELIKTSKNIHSRSCSYKEKNKTNKKPEDSVIKTYWPMEKWDQTHGTSYEYPENNQYFPIPISAFKDTKFSNLFLAGKSINVSESIQASSRVMGICMATGEQAVIIAANHSNTKYNKRL
jgi:hypothetical protein